MSDWCAWIEEKAKEVLKVIDDPEVSLGEAEQILMYAKEMLENKRVEDSVGGN